MKTNTFHKRIWAILMVVLLATACVGFAPCAMAETATVAVSSAPALNWTEIVSQIVIWLVGGVLTAVVSVATYAAKKYLYPWLRDVAVPWLRQNNLLAAAKVAVEYAEAIVGRFNGEEKLQLALTIMESKGWVKSDEVYQAIMAKWKELDIAQVAAGVKETLEEKTETTT